MNSPGVVTGIRYLTMKSTKQNNKQINKNNKINKTLQRMQRGVGQVGTMSAAAAAYSLGQKTKLPNISTARGRTGLQTRIVHRELIFSVVGSTTFTIAATFNLNPGLAATFPWLSTQASNWEQYHFNKLRFCYYTRCATTTPGSIIMAPDYDAADAAPSTEQIASSYRDTVEEVPWVEQFCCELDPLAMCDGVNTNRKFTRSGTVLSTDIKTYDVGNLFLCTTDGTGANWGKLWVEYDVDLFVPQLPPTYATFASANITAAGAISKTNILGTTPVFVGNLNVTGSGMTLTFSQVGQFLISAYFTGTALFAVGQPIWSSTGTISNDVYAVTPSTLNALVSVRLTITSTGQTVTLVDSGSTAITACVISIASYAVANGAL